MVNKLILDGVEYALSDELVAKLKESVAAQKASRKRNSFCRVSRGERYFFIDDIGLVRHTDDYDAFVDEKRFCKTGNYCSDYKLMEQKALHETLNRLLWRYSETHGGDPRWMLGDYPSNVYHYEIAFAPASKVFRVVSAINAKTGGIYFKDAATAEAAIEEVVKPFLAEHTAFVW